jgi:hypothetical protein
VFEHVVDFIRFVRYCFNVQILCIVTELENLISRFSEAYFTSSHENMSSQLTPQVTQVKTRARWKDGVENDVRKMGISPPPPPCFENVIKF